MALEFEYGINIGNRFLDLAGHDEDPDELVAQQTKLDEKAKKAAKVTKAATPAPTKKTATATNPTVAAPTKNNNKENLAGKSTNTDQRKQASVAFNDNNNPTPRFEGGRGGRGGYPRRGNSAGQERFSNEGGNRGGSGNYQRPPRVNRNEGQSSNTESSGFQQSVDDWSGDVANEGQRGGEYRGNNRGRGTRSRGIFEVRRGGGRGRGPRGGGRGYGNNRPTGDDTQQPLTSGTDTGNWEQSAEANPEEFRIKSARSTGHRVENVEQSGEVSYDQEGAPRGSRGGYRGRTFRSNRNYGGDRVNNPDREFTGQDERRNRRQHDRERRNEVSGVKAVEKKDGEGAHNWGAPTEAPEETPAADDSHEDAGGAGGQSTKNWSELVDEAEKQLTLDEYRKKQLEAKKNLNQEKLPQLNRRVANEGEDPKAWKDVKEVYRKKNDDDEEAEDNDEEAGSDVEEGGSEEDQTNEQFIGKKKVITIPLEFKPIDSPRGPRGSFGPRGGSRRGSGRTRDGPNRDEQQAGPDGSNQQQSTPSDQTGDYSNEDRPRSGPRGGARGGPNSRPPHPRSDFRRSYANSARGSREGQNRSRVNEAVLNLHNPKDFPSLEKKT